MVSITSEVTKRDERSAIVNGPHVPEHARPPLQTQSAGHPRASASCQKLRKAPLAATSRVGTIVGDAGKRHLAVFRSPGTLFAEVSRRPVERWDPVLATQMAREIVERHGARPYGFHFITQLEAPPVTVDGEQLRVEPKEIDQSPPYFLGGTVRTFDELVAEGSDRTDILRSNMQSNGWPLVIEIRTSYLTTQPFEPDCLVVDPETGAVVERGDAMAYEAYRAKKTAEWEEESKRFWADLEARKGGRHV